MQVERGIILLWLLAQESGAPAAVWFVAGGVASLLVLIGVLVWLMYRYIQAKERQLTEVLKAHVDADDRKLWIYRDETRLLRESCEKHVLKQQELDLQAATALAAELKENTVQTRMLAASVGNLAERIGETHKGPVET